MHLEVPRLPFETLTNGILGEKSSAIGSRVLRARERQLDRFNGLPFETNSDMTSEALAKFCELDQPSRELLKQAVERYKLSARAYHRVIKVARTIADLAGVESITLAHLAEALQFRLQVGQE